eukprot:Pgem_evm1s3292
MFSTLFAVITVAAAGAVAQETNCYLKTDIVFLFDRSGSIGNNNNYRAMVDFSESIIREFEQRYQVLYGNDGMKVAWAEYGNGYRALSGGQFLSDKSKVFHQISGLPSLSYSSWGGTYTASAMKTIANSFFTDQYVNRGQSKLAFVFTDGKASDNSKVDDSQRLLFGKNVEIFAVGIAGADTNGLQRIVGKKSNGQYYNERIIQAGSFEDLSAALGETIGKLCEVACQLKEVVPCAASCNVTCPTTSPEETSVQGTKQCEQTIVQEAINSASCPQDPPTVTKDCTTICPATCTDRSDENCEIYTGDQGAQDPKDCFDETKLRCEKCKAGTTLDPTTNECQVIACSTIANAEGNNVSDKPSCKCTDGNFGDIIPTYEPPYYSGSCDPCNDPAACTPNPNCTVVPNCYEPVQGCTNGAQNCKTCEDGYELVNNECRQIDECVEGVGGVVGDKACHENRVCTDTSPLWTCEDCSGAFVNVGDFECEACKVANDTHCTALANECTSDNPGAEQKCQTCEEGFTYNPQTNRCEDKNECLDSPCDEQRVCINTEGSFQCGNCNNGFINDGPTGCQECKYSIDNCTTFEQCTTDNLEPKCSECSPGFITDETNSTCVVDDALTPAPVQQEKDNTAAIAGGVAAGAVGVIGAGLLGYKLFGMKQNMDLLEAERNAYLADGDNGANPMFKATEVTMNNAMVSP